MGNNYLVDEADDSSDNNENEAELNELRQKLLKHCTEFGIEAEIKEGFRGNLNIQVKMPNGREQRLLALSSSKEILKALDVGLQNYTFLGDYIAIADYQKNTIEAEICSLHSMPSSYLNRTIFGGNEGDESCHSILLKNDSGQVAVEISAPSEPMMLLTGPSVSRRWALTLKISGITLNQHKKCLKLLRRITDSLFFQLEMRNGLALSLTRDRRRMMPLSKTGINPEINLEFPRVEFDEDPISLYWYARSALRMPLLQFLAYYQVIEYYFPTYSQEEARKRIRAILKDPTFRTDRDADIGRVLTVVSGTRRGFGDEKSQLRATLIACLDPAGLREYIYDNPVRTKFFSTKHKGLTKHKIPIGLTDADLRSPVADRIYDIRCRIVHTKGDADDGDIEFLLPYSKEAELLFHDIALLQYVARQVLISASTPMSL